MPYSGYVGTDLFGKISADAKLNQIFEGEGHEIIETVDLGFLQPFDRSRTDARTSGSMVWRMS